MTMKRVWVGTAAALTTLALTAGCAAQQTTDDSGTAPAAGGELKAVPGFNPDTKEITVGNILALSGPLAAGAKEQLIGQNAWFEKVNADGGIKGEYKVKLVTADNQYNAQLAVQAYEEIKNDIVMLSGTLGTPSVRALLPLLERTKANMVPSNQDATIKDEPALVPTFASYQTNVVNAVSYLVSQDPALKNAKFCALVIESAWGDAVKEGLTYIAGKYGQEVASDQRFAPTDTAFTAQIQALKSAGCQVVVWGGAENATPAMVAAATQLNFTPHWISEFIGVNISYAKMPIAPYIQEHFLITGPGNKLDDTSVPGIKVIKDAIGDDPVTLQYVYGYIQAVATTTVLEKAIENGDLSNEGIRKTIETMGEISDFQGLQAPLKLGETRTLPQGTTLYKYNPTDENPYGLEAIEVLYEAPEGNDPKF